MRKEIEAIVRARLPGEISDIDPIKATDGMVQPVGKDENGRLWTFSSGDAIRQIRISDGYMQCSTDGESWYNISAVNELGSSGDWEESNPGSKAYIKNRTHYKIKGAEEVLFSEEPIEVGEFGEALFTDFSLEAGEEYKIILDGEVRSMVAQSDGGMATLGNLSLMDVTVLSRDNFAPLAKNGVVSSIVVFYRAEGRYFAIDGSGKAVEIKLLGDLENGTAIAYDKSASIIWTANGVTSNPLTSSGGANDWLDFTVRNPSTGKYLLPTIDGNKVHVVMDDLRTVSGRSHIPGFHQTTREDELKPEYIDKNIDLVMANKLAVSNSNTVKCCLAFSLVNGEPVFSAYNWGDAGLNVATGIKFDDTTTAYVAQVNTGLFDNGEKFCLRSNKKSAVGAIFGGESVPSSMAVIRKVEPDTFIALPPEYLPKEAEVRGNRVSVIDGSSDDEHYPTAKAVYEKFINIEKALDSYITDVDNLIGE